MAKLDEAFIDALLQHDQGHRGDYRFSDCPHTPCGVFTTRARVTWLNIGPGQSESKRPVITPKTLEVEDCHGDHWFRMIDGFEMVQMTTDAQRIILGPEDLEHLFGPVTEISRAGSQTTMYPQRTALDEGFEPDDAEQGKR